MPAVTLATIVSALVKLAISLAVSAAATLITSLLTKPSSRGAVNNNPLQTGLSVAGPKREIVGQVGVRASSLIFNQKIGRTHHWGAVVSDQPITTFGRVFIRGEEVELDEEGWVVSEPWAEGSRRTIQFRFFDGTQTDLPQDLKDLELLPAGAFGYETAFVWAQLTVPQTPAFVELFQGTVPDFVFELFGSKVFDPTDPTQDMHDRSTWKWAEEAILIQAYHQVSKLGRNRPVDEIDWAQVATLVPRHREPVTSLRGDTNVRLAIGGAWFAQEEDFETTQARLGAAHTGGLVDMAISANALGNPLQQFFSSDVGGQPFDTIGPRDIGPSGARRNDVADIDTRPNSVRVTFPNENNVWESDTLQIRINDFVTEDGGEERYTDLELDTVTRHRQAAMLGLIQLYRERLGVSVDGEFSLRLLRARAGDFVSVANPEWSLTGAERFRVDLTGISERDYPTLSLSLDDPTWHADPGSLEPKEIIRETQANTPTDLDPPIVTVTSGATALVEAGGVILPGARVVVTGEAGAYDSADIALTYGTGDGQREFQAFRRFGGNASVMHTFGPIPAGELVQVDVRVSASASRDATAMETHIVTGDTIAPPAPTGLSTAGGAGGFSVSAQASTASDLAAVVFGHVANGDPAPDLLTDGTRRVVGAISGEIVSVTYDDLPSGPRQVYAAAQDKAGNLSPLTGPESVTVL